MKITSVEIHPDGSSNIAVLSFRDPDGMNPYDVLGMAGLDPVDIIPQYQSGSGRTAAFDMISNNRQPVILIKLNPDFVDKTYSDLRDDLYRMIASSRTGKVEIQFKNGTDIVASIVGSIIKNEAPQFEKEQQVRLTIFTDEPFLRSPTRRDLAVSHIDFTDFEITDNISTAPHGFIFELSIQQTLSSIIITDPLDDSWRFEVRPAILGGSSLSFIAGDVLFLSSERNNRYIYMARAGYGIDVPDIGHVVPIADRVVAGSSWPVIYPHENHLSINVASPSYLNYLRYYLTYWGV